jgi:hypothetical protein
MAGGTITGFSFTHPTGSAIDDALIAIFGAKDYTRDVSSGTFLSNYTLLGNVTDGTVANGLDVGSVRNHTRYRIMQSGDTAPSVSTNSGPSPRMSAMLSYTRAGTAWDIAAETGTDGTATGTSISITAGADPGYEAGDVVIVTLTVPTNDATLSSEAITVPGCTLGTVNQRLSNTVTSAGNDGGMYAYEAEVSSGTSSGAPSFSATTATDFSSGSAVFIRLREVGYVASAYFGGKTATRLGMSQAVHRAASL